MNEPFEIPDRGFTVTVTGKKVYADYEIRDMAIRSVSVYIYIYIRMQGEAMCSDRLMNLLIYTSSCSHQVIDQSAKPLKLKHFFFTAWPDHGVPQHPYSLVKFIQHVRKMLQSSPAPLVVHCRYVSESQCVVFQSMWLGACITKTPANPLLPGV